MRQPDFDERLREVFDVDGYIEEENKLLKEMANKRQAFPVKKDKEIHNKDNDLISKVNLLAKAVVVEEPPLFGIDITAEYI